MAPKLAPIFFQWMILLTCLLFFLYSTLLPLYPQRPTNQTPPKHPIPFSDQCNLFNGKWVLDPNRRPMYDGSCPFHRNSWNCLRNQREDMGRINSWKWVPEKCQLSRIDPLGFMDLMKNKRIGFVGDSLNENFLASFLCILRVADLGGKKWKKKGAWRGADFPNFNLTVGYHRAVLLAKYQWQPKQAKAFEKDELKGTYRVDVDIPSDDWADIVDFYDILVFNTGHWWGYDKFPKETPLVFHKAGQPILPPLGILDGYKVVLENMVAYIERENYLERCSNFGVFNHLGTSMVVTGIKMGVACSRIPSRNSSLTLGLIPVTME